MKLPKINKPEKFKGLYIIDFGDYSSVGFTAEEVELLLESEKFRKIKVYKIHNAYPDGKMEIKGVQNQIFQLELGMFFYSHNLETAKKDFNNLINIPTVSTPPCRAKVHLAKYSHDKFATALIFPAENNDEISAWLINADYKTTGTVDAGTNPVQNYYAQKPNIIQRHQINPSEKIQSKDFDRLLSDIRKPIQRLAG